MGKIIPTKINDWSGGVTNDRRSNAPNVSTVIKHFDPRTRAHALIPYRSYEDGDSSSSTQEIVTFLVHGSTIYGLGEVSGTARVKIFSKSSSTLSDATWATPANGESATRSKNDVVFVAYRKTNTIYGLHGGDQIWSFVMDGSAFNETAQALSYTNAAQGIVHSKDDILYIGYDNKIASKNGAAAWNTTALTLPEDMIVSSLCEFGNYLAIGCRSQQAGGKSRVYLWDRDSSLSTLSESIDWGSGELNIIEEIEGSLVGISSQTFDAGNLFKKVVFRYWDGGSGAKIFKELECDLGGALGLGRPKQKVNNTLFFILSITQQGTQNAGVWGIGRNKVGDPLAVWLDRLTDNSSTVTPDGFIFYGDYAFISYNSGDQVMAKTDDQSNFTATSVVETTIKDAGDSSQKKDLVGVSVMHEPLPASGQIVVKYKKDAETSFTTIMTNTTDDSISKDITALSGTLPKAYKEITFRIESTGGAVLTGLTFDEEITGNRSYE